MDTNLYQYGSDQNSFLIDTHAHLANEKYFEMLEHIVANAKNFNVHKIISIGCSTKEAQKSLEISKKYKGIVYATAGLYPHDNEPGKNLEERFEIIEKLAQEPEIVAIGECGLDYTQPSPKKAERSIHEQKEIFVRQIDLAQKLNKPFVIHSRDATQDTLDVLTEHPYKNGVWHCFVENYEIAKKLIDNGNKISVTGIITYPSAPDLRETIKKIPLEEIMIETDCPYLVPQELRKSGEKVNQPAYVKMVAQEIALIKGISLEEVTRITTKNAINFFKI